MTKARAVVSTEKGRVALLDVEIGEPGDWDLTVELEYSAISVGTESYVLSGDRYPRPYIPGYSPLGRVVKVGKNAMESYAVGDRVTYFQPNKPDHMIQNCGGHQSPALIDVNPERLRSSNHYCVKVPDGLGSERAAFGGISSISCLGISLSRLNVGDKALVVGQGMIGQFAAQYLKLRGAEVAVADLHGKRLLLAAESGADYVIHSGQTDFVEEIRKIWPGGADIVVDTTGNDRIVEKAANALYFGGKFVLLGWVKGKEFSLEAFHGRIFEALFPWGLEGPRIASSWRLMNWGALKIDHLITHRFQAHEAQTAYDLIFEAPDQYVGILLDWRAV